MPTDGKIRKMLRRHNGNRTRTAAALGMSPTTLRRRLAAMPPEKLPTSRRGRPASRPVDPQWAEFVKAGRPDRLRGALVERYRKLVDVLVAKVRAKVPPTVTTDELTSAGLVGLLDAMATYEPSRGTKFETHAQKRIRGEMLDELRRTDPVGRKARARAKTADAATDELASRLGRPPTDDELADEIGPAALVAARPPATSSIDRAVNDWHNKNRPLFHRDLLPAKRRQSHTVRFFERVTRGLDFEARVVLYLNFALGHTLKLIGCILALSESRVSQVRTHALADLRRMRDRDEVLEVFQALQSNTRGTK